MIQETVKFLRMKPDVKVPVRATQHSAGYDIISQIDFEVLAQDKYLYESGFKLSIPEGYYGRIAPRGGIASTDFIDVGAGVIDSDYRGEVKKDFQVKKGERIAQIIFQVNQQFNLEISEKLDTTQRQNNGFGSTGYNQIF